VLQACRVTSLHESGHCLVGRFLGLPIAAATSISSEHFHGQVRATEAPENASPEELVAAAETLCSRAAARGPARAKTLWRRLPGMFMCNAV